MTHSNEALHHYESTIWFSAQVAAPDIGRPGCIATTLTDNAAATVTPPAQPRLAAASAFDLHDQPDGQQKVLSRFPAN